MISLDSNVRTSYFSVAPICIARKHTRFGLMVKWCASIHHISSAIATETQFLWGQLNFYEVNPIFHKPSPLFQLFFGWFFHVFSHPHIPTWWWFNRSQNPAAPSSEGKRRATARPRWIEVHRSASSWKHQPWDGSRVCVKTPQDSKAVGIQIMISKFALHGLNGQILSNSMIIKPNYVIMGVVVWPEKDTWFSGDWDRK